MTFINLVELIPKSLILTPNERLNRRLHKLYGKQIRATGLQAWPAPSILSWRAMLQQLYQTAIEQGLLSKILLSEAQYHQIWYQIIDTVLNDHDFLHPRQTAIEMSKAWQILKQWRFNYSELNTSPSQESALLIKAIRQVDSVLKKNNWLVADDLPNELAKLALPALLEQIAGQKVEKIILFGFDEMTPLSHFFCEILKQQGLNVESINWHCPATLREQHALPSSNQEYIAMALWAKTQLKHGYQQIACIIPELTSSRAQLTRIFYESLHPDTLFESYSTSPYFNISGGEALANLPLFQTLFHFLALFDQQIDYQIISHLLLSPFVAQAETEQLARAALDKILREKLLQNLHYQDLPLELLSEYTPAFSQVWQQIITRDPKQQLRLPSAWIEWLNSLLMNWGWPGERIINSTEYQQFTQWQKVLSDLVTLDPFCELLSYKQFIELLKETLNQIPFEIKTHDAPIQILGALEAAGSLFDCIWISGLTDKDWPPSVKPNPYIPYDLQKRLNMPHSSSQRQYEYSLSMMERWINSTPEIHFSYAEYDGDQPLSPSPLLHLYQPALIPASMPPQLAHKQIHNQQEFILEDAYLAFSDEENNKSFSASLFEQQINCPFQAFAKQRLFSEEFSQPKTSWDPRLRGINLHAVMEKLWEKWRDQHSLKQLSAADLQQQIQTTVEIVLKKNLPSLYRRPDYFQLEKARLTHIISDWLSIEKQRSAFEVAKLEYSQQTQINKLTIKLRIDRIDRTDDDAWILIDYKTNTQNINDWFGLRPAQPQMLLYANVFEQSFDAITYACLHPSQQKMTFTGISRHELLFSELTAFDKIKQDNFTSWDAMLTGWKAQIQQIAQDFVQGDLRIAPKNNGKACDHCHLHSLCRINDK